MKTAKCSRPALKMAKGGIVRYPLDSEPSPTGGVRGYGVPHLQAGLVPVVETAAQRMERERQARLRAAAEEEAAFAAKDAAQAAKAPARQPVILAPQPTPQLAPQPAVQPIAQPVPRPAIVAPPSIGAAANALASRNIEALGSKHGFRRGTPFVVAPKGVAKRGDKVDAKLEHGEAVLPKKTVQAIGPENLLALIQQTNDGKMPELGVQEGAGFQSGAAGFTFDTLDDIRQRAAAARAADPTTMGRPSPAGAGAPPPGPPPAAPGAAPGAGAGRFPRLAKVGRAGLGKLASAAAPAIGAYETLKNPGETVGDNISRFLVNTGNTASMGVAPAVAESIRPEEFVQDGVFPALAKTAWRAGENLRGKLMDWWSSPVQAAEPAKMPEAPQATAVTPEMLAAARAPGATPNGTRADDQSGRGMYTAADGTPTDDWTRTQAYAEGVARANKDKFEADLLDIGEAARTQSGAAGEREKRAAIAMGRMKFGPQAQAQELAQAQGRQTLKAGDLDVANKVMLANLRNRYMNAKDPEEQKRLHDTILAISGQAKPSQWKAIHAAGGTDPNDPMGMRKMPDQVVVVDERTGQARVVGGQLGQAAPTASSKEYIGKSATRGGHLLPDGTKARVGNDVLIVKNGAWQKA